MKVHHRKPTQLLEAVIRLNHSTKQEPLITSRQVKLNPLLNGWEECTLFDFFRRRWIQKNSSWCWGILGPFNPNLPLSIRLAIVIWYPIVIVVVLWRLELLTISSLVASLLPFVSFMSVGIVLFALTLLIISLVPRLRRKSRAVTSFPISISGVFCGGGGYLEAAATDLWLCGVKGTQLYRAVYLDGYRRGRPVSLVLQDLLFVPFIWFALAGVSYVHEFWGLWVAHLLSMWVAFRKKQAPAAGLGDLQSLCTVIAPHRLGEIRDWWGNGTVFLQTFAISMAVQFAIFQFSVNGLHSASVFAALLMLVLAGTALFLVAGSIVENRSAISRYEKLMETADQDFELFMRQTVMEDSDYVQEQ